MLPGLEFEQFANIAGRHRLQAMIPRKAMHELVDTQAEGVDPRGIQIIQAMWQGRHAHEQLLRISGVIHHLKKAQVGGAGMSTQVGWEKRRWCDIDDIWQWHVL